MPTQINVAEIIYQERWQSGWTAAGSGLQIGGVGGLKLGGRYVRGLLKIIVLKDRLILRPQFPFDRFLPSFFSYNIPFSAIERCEVHRQRFLGQGIVLVFRAATGEQQTIQFGARNPEKIRMLCTSR